MNKICIIGGGSWGTAVAKMIAENIHNHKDFDQEVILWMYDEFQDGKKIATRINEDHVNLKYLKGVKLPRNILATSNAELVYECTLVIFAVPFQFVKSVAENIKVNPDSGVISLTKGFLDDECTTSSMFLSEYYSTDVGVMLGANIAEELAKGYLTTTTLACRNKAELFKRVLSCDYMKVQVSMNVFGAEICGALKNIVAIAYGIACGLKTGENTKAAIIGQGIREIRQVLEINGLQVDILFESCGIPDLIVTCQAGRNCKYGIELVTGKPSYELCQGVGTSKAVYNNLKNRKLVDRFFLVPTVYKICHENLDPSEILKCIE